MLALVGNHKMVLELDFKLEWLSLSLVVSPIAE